MADGFGSLAAASGYGGGGGGYEKEIDCNSALGLLGLLGLIELLRDIVEDVVTPPTMKRRRRRSIDHLLYNVIPGASLIHTLPAILIPMLHSAVDANDGMESPACFQLSTCQANQILTSDSTDSTAPGGVVSSMASSLLTQVVAKAFTEDTETYLSILKAGETGRNIGSGECSKLYPECFEQPDRHTPVPGANITSLLRDHLA